MDMEDDLLKDYSEALAAYILHFDSADDLDPVTRRVVHRFVEHNDLAQEIVAGREVNDVSPGTGNFKEEFYQILKESGMVDHPPTSRPVQMESQDQ